MLHRRASSLFHRHGVVVAQRPGAVIGASLLWVAACALGLLGASWESRVEYVHMPRGVQSFRDCFSLGSNRRPPPHAWTFPKQTACPARAAVEEIEQLLGKPPRVAEFIARPTAPDSNMLSIAALTEAVAMHEAVLGMTVRLGGSSSIDSKGDGLVTFEDVCERAYEGGPCRALNVLARLGLDSSAALRNATQARAPMIPTHRACTPTPSPPL